MRNALIPRESDVWDPFNLFRNVREELGRPFELAVVPGKLWGSSKKFFAPDIDVKDEKDRIVVKADIPGIKKEDLTISVKEDVLTLKGERKEAQEKKEKDYYYSERFEGSFVRTIGLPAAVKASAVKATYKDGVLEITLPKDEGAKSKEINVPVQ